MVNYSTMAKTDLENILSLARANSTESFDRRNMQELRS